MEFEETDYILGIWFGERKGEHNYLVTAKRDEDGYWSVQIRFRQFVDTKAFGSQDPKSFAGFKTKTPWLPEEKVKAQCDSLFGVAKTMFGFTFTEYVEIKGDVHKFMFKLAMTDWGNMKILSKEQAKDFEKDGTIPEV